MARPKKQIVDYFPHDCNHGKTMFAIEAQFGNDGYLLWFKLLEMLGKTEGHRIDCNNTSAWVYLCAYINIGEDRCKEIISYLARLEAIDKNLWDKGIIWSQNFIDRLQDVYTRRKIPMPTIKKVEGVDVDINPQGEAREGMDKKLQLDHLPAQHREWLTVLSEIPKYPFNLEMDIAFLLEKEKDYPKIDITSLLKGWRAYLIDKPLTKNSRPCSQLHNQFELAMKWGKHLKKNDGHKPPVEDDVLTKIKKERAKEKASNV